MGLGDEMRRADAADEAARAASRRRAEATYETAARVWADFLSSCREFAELAPGRGLPPTTGKKVIGRIRNKERGNWDYVVDHPGGWAFNREGFMFYVRTDGTLMVQREMRKRPALLPTRTLYLCVFQPCPAFPDSPSALLDQGRPERAVMPWKFALLPGGGYLAGNRSDAVTEDIRRLGGALTVDTHEQDEEGMKLVFAKDLLLAGLRPAR